MKQKKRDSRNGIKQHQQAKQETRNKKERKEKNTREEGGIRRRNKVTCRIREVKKMLIQV